MKRPKKKKGTKPFKEKAKAKTVSKQVQQPADPTTPSTAGPGTAHSVSMGPGGPVVGN